MVNGAALPPPPRQEQGTFCQAWINFCITEPHPSTVLTQGHILVEGEEVGSVVLGAD